MSAPAAIAALKVAYKLPPQQALEYLQGKGYALTWHWHDMLEAAHAKAFTVAKVATMDLLQDIRGAFTDHLATGKTAESFVKTLTPTLKAKGWWGRLPLLDAQGQPVLKPDGTPRTYLAGSPHRLRTIYRVNKNTAVEAGRWRAFENAAKTRPWLQYIAIADSRVRPSHLSLNGRIFHITDPIWRVLAPPNGWNCRCRLRALSDKDLKRLGLEDKVSKSTPADFEDVQQVAGVDAFTGEQIMYQGRRFKDHVTGDELLPDPGWSYNPGRAGAKELNKLLAAKAKAAADVAAAQAQAAKTAAAKASAQAAKAALLALAKEAGKAALAERTAASIAASQQAAAASKSAALAQQAKAAMLAMAKAEGQRALAESMAKASERAAQASLDAITGGKAGGANTYLKGALKALKTDPDWPAKTAKDKLAAVHAEAAALKQAGAIKAQLANYEKWVLAGTAPTKAHMAALAKLPQADQDAFLQALAGKKAAKDAAEAAAQAAAAQAAAAQAQAAAAAQAAPAATMQPAALNFADLEQIGPQGGSNPGGLFRHKVTGEQWYIKVPRDADQARNEVLTAKLYEAVGVQAPEYAFLTVDGAIGGTQYQGAFGIASKIIAGVGQDAAALRAGSVAGVADGFVADAWLANWDVVGLGYDNLLVAAGRAVRVDTGGGLLYRAQGGAKGPAFGPRVTELDSLRDASINPQAASVFRHASQADLETGAARILSLPDTEIRALVDRYGPGTDAAKRALADTLIARKGDLAVRFPGAVPRAAPAPATAARLTASERQAIADSRINGWARPSDGGDIEDQNLLLWAEADAAGQPLTGAFLKVRGAALAKLEASVAQAGGPVSTAADQVVFDKVLSAIKGIAFNHAQGLPLRQIDIDRAADAYADYMDRIDVLRQIDMAQAAAFEAHYKPYIDAIDAATGPGVGQVAAWTAPPAPLTAWFAPPPPPAPGALAWQREAATFEHKAIDRGNAQRTGAVTQAFGHRYSVDLNGVQVRYYPDDPAVPFALRRRVEVFAPGADAGDDVLDRLESLGVDVRAATPADREELYLRRIVYHRNARVDTLLRDADAIADQPARVQYLRDELSKDIGADITQAPGYDPLGTHQAFGHGRAHQVRPDLALDPDWAKFRRDYRLHHQITQGDLVDSLERIINGGGQMAATSDKLRRGIPIGGMSPTQDLQTGGGSYFFTRIKKAASARQTRGLVWRAEHVGRLDAISYDHDAFGRVDGNYVTSRRRTGVAQWQAAATAGGNETIFKDGLSLFDDLERIVAGSAAERDQVIDMLKRQGYARWPDGRPVEDVVTIS